MTISPSYTAVLTSAALPLVNIHRVRRQSLPLDCQKVAEARGRMHKTTLEPYTTSFMYLLPFPRAVYVRG
jgi:hypothetical protein